MAFYLYDAEDQVRVKKGFTQNDYLQKDFYRFLEQVGGVEGEPYEYHFDKQHLRSFITRFEENTCLEQTIASMLGEEKPFIHEFPLSEEGFDTLKLEPFPFQKVGINFLSSRPSGLIADSMGLGKTIQAIGTIHRLHLKGEIKRCLVLCPASIKYQWADEIEKFTEHKGLVLDGTGKKRQKVVDEYLESDTLFLVANYELLRTDAELLASVGFDAIVCDEAHRIKNRSSKTYKGLLKVPARYRYALTGTPLQNKPEEIFALLDWLSPGALGKITAFKKRYIVTGTKFGRPFQPLGTKRLDELRELINPHMFRRTKEEVLPDLPEILYNKYEVTMTPAIKTLYKEVMEEFLQFSKEIQDYYQKNSTGKMPNEEKVMGYLFLMIAISDHPAMLLGSQGYLSKKFRPFVTPDMGSPKLKELLEIIESAIEDPSSKIVIFTQYAKMLDIIVKAINPRFDMNCAIVKGELSAKQRHAEITRFKTNPDCRVIVMTDAGNYGINLFEGNIVINYDNQWNPAIREQRIGRIHRIGSKHQQVQVIDMVTKDTIDEMIWQTIERKTRLNQALVENTDEENAHLSELLSRFIR